MKIEKRECPYCGEVDVEDGVEDHFMDCPYDGPCEPWYPKNKDECCWEGEENEN